MGGAKCNKYPTKSWQSEKDFSVEETSMLTAAKKWLPGKSEGELEKKWFYAEEATCAKALR